MVHKTNAMGNNFNKIKSITIIKRRPAMDNKKCVMCGRQSNGIILKGNVICLKCENSIISTSTISQQYDIYVTKIKKILFK